MSSKKNNVIKIQVAPVFERLKSALNLKNDAALARSMGIKPSKLSVWKLRNFIPFRHIITLCSHNQLNFNWALWGDGESLKRNTVKYSLPFDGFPVLREIPQGFPQEISEEAVEYVFIPGAPLESYAMTVRCDCLNPLIKNGDFVVFDRDGKIKNGDIVVVLDQWGATTLKRYHKKQNKVFLVNDNPEYPPASLEDGYKIVGKVVDVWRRIGL